MWWISFHQLIQSWIFIFYDQSKELFISLLFPPHWHFSTNIFHYFGVRSKSPVFSWWPLYFIVIVTVILLSFFSYSTVIWGVTSPSVPPFCLDFILLLLYFYFTVILLLFRGGHVSSGSSLSWQLYLTVIVTVIVLLFTVIWGLRSPLFLHSSSH